MQLGFSLTFDDLYSHNGLSRLDAAFCAWLEAINADLYAKLMTARAAPESVPAREESILLLELASYVEDFIGELFGNSEAIHALQDAHQELAPLYRVKRLFVQRQAVKAYTPEQAASFDGYALCAALGLVQGDDMAFARAVESAESRKDEGWLTLAKQYAAWAVHTPVGNAAHKRGVLFKLPRKLAHDALIPLETMVVDGVTMAQLPESHARARRGFSLTDTGFSLEAAMDNANYCIWCHNQGKDSCSKGMKDKATGAYTRNAHGTTLAGCPLEEKISEMNLAKADGFSVAALAIITVDNPMCAGTGHRICNDCMKSCIYQKQEPVNIPAVETRSLEDVLRLPWGAEIYSLLTRWNPMNIRRPVPRPPSGYKVLVVGMGPAGSTLAHHLMNDGHTVVGIDGLKIEPLPEALSGVTALGARVPFQPIRDWASLVQDLHTRPSGGFGGVAEYGITVRWNKNYLTLLRLLLERREAFTLIGGVRFGGTLTVDDAFAMGFDHIALCMGAGRPTLIPMKNSLAQGVRQASDFLMALQLTGAAREDSLANLQVRLPIVVIGGGLTAIDTATESLAYYPVQVEKFLARYETLVAEQGEAAVRLGWSALDNEIAEEFIAHARALRAAPVAEHRALLQQWGGATVVYRKRLVDAPSYTLNHEEVEKALEEGIRFAECLAPEAVNVDAYGCAQSLTVRQQLYDNEQGYKASEQTFTLPARTILIAAGTQPNTVLAREDASIELDGRYFQAIDMNGARVAPERIAKPSAPAVLMHCHASGGFMSFFGDLHPSFAGNVVKAMGSAKQGYPVVSRTLAARAPSAITAHALQQQCNAELRAVVHDVIRLTPTIVEVVVHAPRAARAFQPGQFYRLQNFEAHAPRRDGTVMAMEGLAMTGASVDRPRGLLSTIVLEMGGSSDLCADLRVGEPVILMGPTGTPTEIPAHKTVLLMGGGLGNAVLFSIGQALRAKGCRVLYVAGYKKRQDRYKVSEIEAAADCIVWACDEAPAFTPSRPCDYSYTATIIDALRLYAGQAGAPIALSDVDHIIAIGSDRMMAAVAAARHTTLKPYLKPNHAAIGSINSPMQCMMKEICAQCLQRHVDPATGLETIVFSCTNQDQPLDHVDFASLNTRLGQNSLAEKLTKQWIARARAQHSIPVKKPFIAMSGKEGMGEQR